jgi:epoxyqueuosine reductase
MRTISAGSSEPAATTLTSARIKARAAELGFDLCGVAAADSFPELSFLREWLDRGYAGDMGWMAQSAALRSDARQVLPGARSVIMTGTLYNTDRPYSQDLPPRAARVSRHAWGDDYHRVLWARHNALVDWMRAVSPEPFETSALVDSGPVQERVYAQYAGLGWVGKNTCLINAELGSWLFLGEIVTTLALEPDTQGAEQCGTCTRCVDACPSGALVDAGVLDARRCLSYLTIELRGAIPGELREAVGTHAYGCDVCQEVCPYNQPAPGSADPAWQPRSAFDAADLVALWTASDEELHRAIIGGPMRRAKLVGLRRNLAVALGNAGDPHAVRVLDAGSPDRASVADPMVQEHVAWARARLTAGRAQP